MPSIPERPSQWPVTEHDRVMQTYRRQQALYAAAMMATKREMTMADVIKTATVFEAYLEHGAGRR